MRTIRLDCGSVKCAGTGRKGKNFGWIFT